MSIRGKVRFLVVGSLVGVILISLLAYTTLVNNLAKLEENSTYQNVGRVLSAFSDELASLDGVTRDWASWDATYAFVQDSNQQYIKENVVSTTFTSIRLNFMIFADTTGKIVYSQGFDSENETEVPIPRSLELHLSANPYLLRYVNLESSISGLILLPEGPVLVASRPILTSDGNGPIRGAMVMGRYLDDSDVERLAKQTHLSLSVYQISSQVLPADFQAIVSTLSKQKSLVRVLDKNVISGYTFLKDIYGQPQMVVRVDVPRDIYQQGRGGIDRLVGAILLVSLVGSVAAFTILQRQVLSRVGRLSRGVSHIGTSGDASSRVYMSGKDELSDLADKINGMLAALHDVHEQLNESEKKFRTLFEQSRDAIYVTTKDARFADVNQAALDLLGYSRSEMMALDAHNIWASPADRDEFIKQLEARGSLVDYETKFRRKDGMVLDVTITAVVRLGDGGRIVGYQGVMRDITQRKRGHEALQASYARESQLRKDLEAEIQRRTEFTRALVHELRTPLTPVLASSEMLVEELKTEPYLSLAKNVYNGATNLNNRIEELIDLAKGEIGILTLNRKPLDPATLINQVAQEVGPMASSRGQSLVVEFLGSLPIVMADEVRLRQVLLNLINNASKFTPAQGQITLRALRQGSNLQVEVQDTGRGIPEDLQKRLFQPYVQVGDDASRLRGMGLGLALCKRLVELHGGVIWVKSEKGKGSTFGFTIPLDQSDERGGQGEGSYH